MNKHLREEKSRIEDRLEVIGGKLWGRVPLRPHESLRDLSEEKDRLERDLRRLNSYLKAHA